MRQASWADVGGWLHKGVLVTVLSGAVVGGGGHRGGVCAGGRHDTMHAMQQGWGERKRNMRIRK